MENSILNYYILFWIFIMGVCLGSFYNVVILRSLSGESVVYPPSKCPKCGQRLKPWHNIPILSYVFLRGKCAFCKEKISIQYPVVELVTGLLFAFVYIKFGFHYMTLFTLLCISCLLIMTVTDLKEKVVDCNYAIFMTVSGLIYAYLVGGVSCIKDAILGAVLGFVIIELLARVGYLLKKGRAMGEADSYVAGALGALVGWQCVLWVLLYSLIASMLFVLPSYWYDRYKEKDAVTLLFSALFIISISFTFYFNNAVWTLLLLFITGLILTFWVVKSIYGEKKLNYLPFVPALSAGFLYYVFFVL